MRGELREVGVLIMIFATANWWGATKYIPRKDAAQGRQQANGWSDYEKHMRKLEKKLEKGEIGAEEFRGASAKELDIAQYKERIAKDPHFTACATNHFYDGPTQVWDFPEACGKAASVAVWNSDKVVNAYVEVTTPSKKRVHAPITFTHPIGEVLSLGDGHVRMWGEIFADNPSPGEHVLLRITPE